MPHVLVAGAGIGGLTAAIALARQGFDVTVLERAAQLDAIGAGLQLSPNATRILDDLGLLNAVRARASAPPRIIVRTAGSARTIATMPLDDAERRWGAPYLVVLRADLQAVLVAAVAAEPRVTLHLDTTLAGFGTDATGLVATVRQRGIVRSIAGDVLIGADGVRSVVRTRLADTGDAPQETGRTAWRALVPTAGLEPCFRTGETGLWLGRDAHLVHYGVDGGRTINIVAVTRETPDGAPADTWSTPGDPTTIRARFAGWHRLARSLIAAPAEWTRWPLYDRAPLATWHAGPVALLGDAAHPILPFLAQGAAQAIEDAAALARALGDAAGALGDAAGAVATSGTGALSDALATYSHTRRARAERVQDQSRQLGRIYHLAGPAALARDVTMRWIGGRALLARYDWLYSPQVPAIHHKRT